MAGMVVRLAIACPCLQVMLELLGTDARGGGEGGGEGLGGGRRRTEIRPSLKVLATNAVGPGAELLSSIRSSLELLGANAVE
jgi:hypothetical protein